MSYNWTKMWDGRNFRDKSAKSVTQSGDELKLQKLAKSCNNMRIAQYVLLSRFHFRISNVSFYRNKICETSFVMNNIWMCWSWWGQIIYEIEVDWMWWIVILWGFYKISSNIKVKFFLTSISYRTDRYFFDSPVTKA